MNSTLSLDRVEEVAQWIIRWISAETDIDEGKIDIERSFADYGFDSVEAAMLAGELSERMDNVVLEPSLFWDVKNIKELAEIVVRLQAAA
ncbi:acyl carrier protein [Pseudomonas sp. J452]|uniref:acyl carrier protein n=1 Tax=Pseudomonas sp. J452 TaxID=2898441 RepID=UPI0021AE07EE|nr:acyl carrier protein [Pseudomonas sp. J452]UUY08380.1 acyl carrier protein [Pseudomonas sp. J452]